MEHDEILHLARAEVDYLLAAQEYFRDSQPGRA